MACLAAATVAAQRAPVLSFDADTPDVAPAGFTLEAMRQNDPGAWIVRRDGANGYLTHMPGPSQDGYALALAPGGPVADLSVSVRMRLAGGGRAGGVVWRYQDANNYYAAILDLSRGAVFMYMMRNGNRVMIEAEDDLELDLDGWHTLRVVHERRSVHVSLGGIRVFEEQDGRLERTFGPGRAGLLATGSSTVWFDDLRLDTASARR